MCGCVKWVDVSLFQGLHTALWEIRPVEFNEIYSLLRGVDLAHERPRPLQTNH